MKFSYPSSVTIISKLFCILSQTSRNGFSKGMMYWKLVDQLQNNVGVVGVSDDKRRPSIGLTNG